MPSPEPTQGTPTEDVGAERTGADDPVARLILDLLVRSGPGKSIIPEDVARAFAEARARPSDPPDPWRRYLMAVRQQALHLARQGRIEILRKGKAVDPTAPVKGVIRLALPRASDAKEI